MTRGIRAAIAVFGISTICASAILAKDATRTVDGYLLMEATGFALGASLVPFVFIYARKITRAYISAFAINFVLTAQAYAPVVAGAALLLFLAVAVGYCLLVPVREAIQLFLYKRKDGDTKDE